MHADAAPTSADDAVLYTAVETGGGDIYTNDDSGGAEGGVLYTPVDTGANDAFAADPAVGVGADGAVLYTAVDTGANDIYTSDKPSVADDPGPILYTPVDTGQSNDDDEQFDGFAGIQHSPIRSETQPDLEVVIADDEPPLSQMSTYEPVQASSGPVWLHKVNRKSAEALLRAAGGHDGMYLVRPRDGSEDSHAFSVILKNRYARAEAA